MKADLYIKVLQHIQRQTSSTKERPILIICDNHESHASIEAINYCRAHGIVYLSPPPHTSHNLQPLDVSVFGPFKGKLKICFNDWHIGNVGKTLSIYNIAALSKTAFLEAFTPKNITSGFAKSGIWPFNRLVFGDDDFAPIEIFSDSSQEGNQENSQAQEVDFVELERTGNIDFDNETMHIEALNQTDPLSTQLHPVAFANRDASPRPSTSTLTPLVSPEVVRPYPKIIRSENTGRKGRERGKSRIYTESPEKTRLQTLADEKVQREELKLIKRKAKELKTAKKEVTGS